LKTFPTVQPRGGFALLIPLGAVAAAVAVLESGALAQDPATGTLVTHVGCGDTITQNTKLENDLTDCPGDGIVIGGDGITLDLNGHTIDGVSIEGSAGVRDESHHGVTVANGTVREFGDGVFAKDARATRLRELVSSNNRFSGIVLIESERTVVSRSRISYNGRKTELVGILVIGSHKSAIKGNKVVGNGASGIQVLDSNGVRVVRNSVARTGETGIDVTASNHTVVRSNVLRRNVVGMVVGGDPQDPRGGVGNRVVKNAVLANSGPGILVLNGVRGTVVQGNTSSRNGEMGIGLIERPTRGTVISRNTANRNGAAGIDVDHPATTVMRNTANRNHDLGIDVVPGVIDGGGNEAKRNGDPLQCTNLECRRAR
jgi:parallel beta-helix repeat protein